MKITPKNWREFQHYKDRRPTWIKLHHKLLDDYDFHCLPLASKALAPMLWLVASEDVDGVINASGGALAFRLRISLEEFQSALKPLIQRGFFVVEHDASEPLADRKQDAIPETYREETETETETESCSASPNDGWPKDYRERFYDAYPRKVGRKAVYRKLEGIRRAGEITFERLMAAISTIDVREPKFIPLPMTWLNQGRYLDVGGEPIRIVDDDEFTRLKAAYDEKVARLG